MEKIRCKDCCWYQPQTEGHKCSCPKMIYGYYGINADNDGLLVEDDEGWGMSPGPNFGCIHWSPK